MIVTAGFSYPADVPPGIGNRPSAQPAPPGLRRMPTTCCFKYAGDMHPCFSYPADVQPGARTRNAAQDGWLHCFSY
jgi:hypothetical protein